MNPGRRIFGIASTIERSVTSGVISATIVRAAAAIAVLSALPSAAITAAVPLEISRETTVFRDAFAASDFAKVEELIARYKKAAQSLPQDADGKTVLHYAIQVFNSDRARFVRMLIQAGVDVNARAWEDATPLHFAARFDCSPCAQELITAGAPVNPRDQDGWTPIFQASEAMVPILIGAGADIRVRDRDGNLPLHRNFRQALIVSGVDVNARNAAGLTPLHFAALAGSVPALQMLVDHGADLSARTTALYWYRAASMSSAFGKGEEVPARSTPLDLARLQYARTKWSTSRYKPAVELLEKLQRSARK